MTRNTRRPGRDTAVTVIGVLLAIGIGWGADVLVDRPDRPDWLSSAVEVVVTLGLCLALGLWLRSRMIAGSSVPESRRRNAPAR